MNKIESIAEVSEISWLTKSNTEKVLDAFVQVITDLLKMEHSEHTKKKPQSAEIQRQEKKLF